MKDFPASIQEAPVDQPFPGLRPFLQHESEIFYGRGEHIDQMLTRLEDHRFLAVVGSSGSGKSSLVRAGLLPALEEGFLTGTSSRWGIVTMRPGGDPYARLAQKIEKALSRADETEEEEDALTAFTEATLRSGPRGLIQVIEDRGVSGEANLLLLVDQFEEIFRFRRRDVAEDPKVVVQRRNDATAFVNLLIETAAERERPVYLVITMRSDFIGDCDAFHGLPEAVSDGQFLTPRLSRSQMEDAIRGPLDVFGWKAEDAMVTAVLNDTGNELDQLPLMQHALMRTWHRARNRRREGEDRMLRLEDYEAVGGLHDALFRHAEEAWEELKDERSKWIAQVMFRSLSERTEESPLTRRIASAKEVAEVAEASIEEIGAVVEVFCRDDRNFLVVNPPRELDELSFLDISHEALMRQWKRFGAWLDAESKSAEIYRSVVRAAEKWKEGEASLWRPPELDKVMVWLEKEKPTRAWTARYGAGYEVGREFVEASRSDYEASVRAEESRGRQLRRARAIAFVIIPIVFMLVWSVFKTFEAKNEATRANEQKRLADDASDRAKAIALALKGAREIPTDPELAILLAMEANLASFAVDGYFTSPEIENSLRLSVASSLLRKLFDGGEEAVRAVEYHPSRNYLVTGSKDGVVRVWDADPRESVREIARIDLEGAVTSLHFIEDGERLIVTTGENGKGGRFFLLDLDIEKSDSTSKLVASQDLKLGESGAISASLRPNRAELAVGGEKNTITLVSTESGEILEEWKHHESDSWISSLTFDPAGEKLLATSWDGMAAVWDLSKEPREAKWLRNGTADEGGRAHIIRNEEHGIAGTFSPTGKRIATGGGDNTLRIWDTESTQLLAEKRHPGGVTDVEFIDDEQLVTASHEGTVRVWNLETPVGVAARGSAAFVFILTESGRFKAHRESIQQLCLSPNGLRVATSSDDGTTREWKLPPGGEVSVFASKSDYWAADIHDFRTHGFAGTVDGELHRWDAYLGILEDRWSAPDLVKGRSPEIRSVAVNHDGSKVVTASNDGRAVVWDADDGRHLAIFEGHQAGGEVCNARFHPSADRVLSAGRDGTARIWTFSDQGSISELMKMTLEPNSDASRPRIYDARFSPDGDRIVTANYDQNTATVWDAESGRKLKVLDGHKGIVFSASFAQDGERIVTASADGTCKIWNWRTGVEICDPIFHGTPVRSAEFNLDPYTEKDLLVTSAGDGIARLWTISKEDAGQVYLYRHALRTELQRHSSAITDARFSNRGFFIVTSSEEGTVRVQMRDLWGGWGVFSTASQRITRKLTLDERKTFGVGRPFNLNELAHYLPNLIDKEPQEPLTVGPYKELMSLFAERVHFFGSANLKRTELESELKKKEAAWPYRRLRRDEGTEISFTEEKLPPVEIPFMLEIEEAARDGEPAERHEKPVAVRVRRPPGYIDRGGGEPGQGPWEIYWIGVRSE